MLGSAFGFLALHGGLERAPRRSRRRPRSRRTRRSTRSCSPTTCAGTCRRTRSIPLQSDALVAFLEHVDASCRCTASAACAATTTVGSPGCSAARTASSRRDSPCCCARAARLPLARRSRPHPVAPARRAPGEPGEPAGRRRRADRAAAARAANDRGRVKSRAGRRTRGMWRLAGGDAPTVQPTDIESAFPTSRICTDGPECGRGCTLLIAVRSSISRRARTRLRSPL